MNKTGGPSRDECVICISAGEVGTAAAAVGPVVVCVCGNRSNKGF